MSESTEERAFAAIGVGPAGDVYHQEGMTLRDWLAGQALVGICAHPDNWGLVPQSIGQTAYQYADAMLAVRAEGRHP